MTARAAEGFGFLGTTDDKWPNTVEAKAAVAAGAEVVSPMVVRMSLIMGKRTSISRVSASAHALVKSNEL